MYENNKSRGERLNSSKQVLSKFHFSLTSFKDFNLTQSEILSFCPDLEEIFSPDHVLTCGNHVEFKLQKNCKTDPYYVGQFQKTSIPYHGRLIGISRARGVL